MKRFPLIMLMLFLALLLSACGENGIYSGKIILGGSLIVHDGEVERSDILLLDGELSVEEGGVLAGNVYQLLGNFNLRGRLDGSLALLSGRFFIGNSAFVTGNLHYGGGEVVGEVENKFGGAVLQSEIKVPFSPAWFAESLRRRLDWAIFEILSLTALAFVLAAIIPQPLARVQAAIGDYPLVSWAMGMLVGIVGLVLLIQMIFTIFLIPVSFLGAFILFLAIGFGWTGFGRLVGLWLVRRLQLDWNPILVAGLGTFLLLFIMNLVRLLPLVGDLLMALSGVIGLGAVFLTRFGFRHFVSAAQKPVAGSPGSPD